MSNEDWNELDESYRSALSGALETAHPAAEQAGGDERAAFEAYRDRRNALLESEGHNPGSKWHVTNAHYPTWEASRAAMAQPSPVRSSLLINGYQLRAALEFIAPDGTAKQLESEARIEWRQQDADFLEAGLYAWCAEYPEEGCVLLDEEPATAQPSPAQAEKAEVERPEVVGQLVTWPTGQRYVGRVRERKGCKTEDVMTVAQHERIVGALRADRDSWAEQAEQRLADWDEMRKERDAALVAQAQHSVPEEFIGRLSEFLAQRGATGKALLRELRTVLAAAPGKEVGHE